MPHSVYEIRRQNLLRLTQYLGAKQALALKLGVTPPVVSFWLKEPGAPSSRQIKEDSARAIEEAMGLSPGELDRPGGRAPSYAKPLDPKLLADSTRAVMDALQQAKRTVSAEKHGDLLAVVYAHAAEQGYVDEDYARRLVSLLG
jgi:DNA-binding transcriptional regulator YdaS (Cro superfamily)